jgi:imidazole glycerol-phosphate synthase subunit HisF
MLRTRIIPTLLLMNESLVKTTQFKKYTYVGDPCNTVRIFNELEVDELVFLDINASKQGRGPNLKLLKEIANECFMPLAYGGGISCLDDAKRVFDVGFEKVILNTHAIRNPELISEIAKQYGNQAVMVSIDIKKDFFGRKKTYSNGGGQQFNLNPVDWCKNVEKLGAGEILLTSIDNEGTWSGFDLDLIKLCVDSVSIPVIAHGGAGSVNHVKQAIKTAGASAVALGSMVVFQKKNMGVLVNVADFSAALD